MKDGPERDHQQMAHCAYNIPCECGKSYVDETGRPLVMRFFEPRHNLKKDLLEKSQL
jgi:hypothetical protein